MKPLMPFLSFSENLPEGALIFQNSVDHFKKENKTCSILVWEQFTFKVKIFSVLNCHNLESDFLLKKINTN